MIGAAIFGLAFTLASLFLWGIARYSAPRRLGARLALALLILLALATAILAVLGLTGGTPVVPLDPHWDWLVDLVSQGRTELITLADRLLPGLRTSLALQLLVLLGYLLLRAILLALALLARAGRRLWARLRSGATGRAGVSGSPTVTAGSDLEALAGGARVALVLLGFGLAGAPLWSALDPAAAAWFGALVWIGAWILLLELGALIQTQGSGPLGTDLWAEGIAVTPEDNLEGLYRAYIKRHGEALLHCQRQEPLRNPRVRLETPASGGAAALLSLRLRGLLAPELLQRLIAPAQHFDTGGDVLLPESLCPHHFLLVSGLIQETTAGGRGVLVLCPDAAVAEVWRSLERHAPRNLRRLTHRWVRADVNDLPADGNEDLVLVPDSAIDRLLLRRPSPMDERLRRIGLVVCLEAQAMDPGLVRYAFARLRAAAIGDTPARILVQAAASYQVEPAMRSLTGSDDLPEFPIQAQLQGRRYVLVWDRDAPLESHRARYFDGLQERVGLDCLLLLPAWERGFAVARLDAGHRHDADAFERFKTYLAQPEHADKQAAAGDHCPVGHGFVGEGSAVTLLDDPGNLLIGLDYDGGSTGLRSSLVSILSGNYLLRDYLRSVVAACDPEDIPIAVRPLAPQPRGSLYTLAYALFQGLSGPSGLTAEEIQDQFLDLASPQLLAEQGIAANRNGLQRLFALAFDTPQGIETLWPGGGDPRYRVTTLQGVGQDAYLDLVNQQGERLGRLARSDHGVTYAVGQSLLVAHKAHRIQEVSTARIQTRHLEGSAHNAGLRHVFHRRFSLDLGGALEEHRMPDTARPGGLSLSAVLLYAPIRRETLGYLTLGEDLRPFAREPYDLSYTTCAPPLVQERPRQSLTWVRIAGLEGLAAERPGARAFTLCALMQDVMESLFPDQYRRIAVVSPQAEPPGGDDAQGWMLRRFYPSLAVPLGNAGEHAPSPVGAGIDLYVIEDCSLDLGIARALSDWNGLLHPLRLLRFYLRWSRERPPERIYQAFGGPAPADCFDYPGVLALLEQLAADGTPPRTADPDPPCRLEPRGGDGSDTECDFCAGPLAPTYDRLADGRCRCAQCGADAIDTPEQFRSLYREVVENMERDYRIELPRDIGVRFVSATKLAAAAGTGFTATPQLDPRAVGLAILERDGTRTLLLENGAPRLSTAATLAHELTHLWQYGLGLNLGKAHDELMEGQARLVEIDYLRRHGGRQLALALELDAQDGTDIYARGYRSLEPKCNGSADSLFQCLERQLRGDTANPLT